MGGKLKHRILEATDIERTLVRLTHEIIERNRGAEQLAVIGIRTRGAPLAERLVKLISAASGGSKVPLGILDITLYRDDLLTARKTPEVRATEINFDINGRNVVLVDDVLFTGRTVRAAIDAVLDFGRPASLQLAILVDRGLREMPIQADYIGKQVVTTPGEEVVVRLKEIDGLDEVVIIQKDIRQEN